MLHKREKGHSENRKELLEIRNMILIIRHPTEGLGDKLEEIIQKVQKKMGNLSEKIQKVWGHPGGPTFCYLKFQKEEQRI